MIFGYFDFGILLILVILTLKFWKTNFNWKLGCITFAILFGFILPSISIVIELERVKATSGEWMDSFEVIYTILRFPTYWLIGIIQLSVIGIRLKYNRSQKGLTE